MLKQSDPGITLVSQRSKEELEKIKAEHINFLLCPDFILLKSPLGILLLDKQHNDFVKTVEQCIVYVKMFGDKESEIKYQQLIDNYGK